MEKKSIIKIGIYVTIAFVILVWGLSYLKGDRLFGSNNHYVVVYNKLNGLAEGCPVMLSGYKIGNVEKIDFRDENNEMRILATLKISSDFRLPKGTMAKIVSVDIMGTKGVEIDRKNGVDTYHADGDTLLASFEGGITDQLMEMMTPVQEHLGSLLSGADSAMHAINTLMNAQNMENLGKSLEDLRKMADVMAANSANLNSMIANLSKASDMLGKNSGNIDRAICNFAELSDSLNAMNLGATLADAQTALQNVNKALESINNGTGTAAQILNNDTLYRNLETATSKINFLLEDFEKHPKKYVNLSIFGGKDKSGKK